MIRVQPYNYEKLKAIADQNSRSISNQLEYLMVQFINKYEHEHGQIPLIDNGSVNINVNNQPQNYVANVQINPN